jgi:RsiW-degrading membrane proteinase PrsW (M82 family)
VAAAALWAVKQDKPFDISMLLDKLFLIPFITIVVLHALWNSPLNELLPFVFMPLIASAGFMLTLTYLAAGLKQYQLARQQGIDA